MKVKMIKNIKCNQHLSYWIATISAFLCALTSGINPFSCNPPVADSAFFVYVGEVMTKGGVMYKDAFDNKGPLLYTIQYLGLKIAGLTGIWLIEVATLVCFMFLIIRLVKIYSSRQIAVIGTLLFITPVLARWMSRGNMSEEYALPFCTYAILVYIEYFKTKTIKKRSIFLLGMSLMFTLLLKPTLISVWIVGCLLCFFDLVYSRRWIELLQVVVLFWGGIATAIIPYIIYFLRHNAINDALFGWLLFNFKWVGQKSFLDRMGALSDFVSESGRLGILVLFGVFLLYIIFYKRKVRQEEIFIIGSSLLYILIVIWSGVFYAHYVITLIPLCGVILAYVSEPLYNFIHDRKTAIGVLFLSIIITIPGWELMGYYIITNDFIQITEAERWQPVYEKIEQLTTENETVYSDVNADAYFATNRISTTRFAFFPTSDLNIRNEWIDIWMDELDKNKPDLFVVDKSVFEEPAEGISEDMRQFKIGLIQEYYTKVDQVDSIWFYRLNRFFKK